MTDFDRRLKISRAAGVRHPAAIAWAMREFDGHGYSDPDSAPAHIVEKVREAAIQYEARYYPRELSSASGIREWRSQPR